MPDSADSLYGQCDSEVWVGYVTPGPDSIQRVRPLEIRVFASEGAAFRWRSEQRPTATSPLREVHQCEVES